MKGSQILLLLCILGAFVVWQTASRENVSETLRVTDLNGNPVSLPIGAQYEAFKDGDKPVRLVGKDSDEYLVEIEDGRDGFYSVTVVAQGKARVAWEEPPIAGRIKVTRRPFPKFGQPIEPRKIVPEKTLADQQSEKAKPPEPAKPEPSPLAPGLEQSETSKPPNDQ